MRSRKRINRKFGKLPPFPPKIGETKEEQIGTVAGSLALRKLYLDNPEYEELAKKLKNNAIKEVRDDTIIKSIIKFLKGQGYDVTYKYIKELLLFYNIAVVLSGKMS